MLVSLVAIRGQPEFAHIENGTKIRERARYAELVPVSHCPPRSYKTIMDQKGWPEELKSESQLMANISDGPEMSKINYTDLGARLSEW